MVDNDKEKIFHDGDGSALEINSEGKKQEDSEDENGVESSTISQSDEDTSQLNNQLQAQLTIDEKEFLRLLVEGLQKPLFQFLRSKIDDEYTNEDIADFIQTTFLRFYSKIQKHKKTSSEPLTLHYFAYLRTIAWHVFLDEASKRQRASIVSLNQPKEGQEEDKSASEDERLADTTHDSRWQEIRLLLDSVNGTIEQLEEPLRTIMILMYKGWTANEISKQLNIKLNTVKSHIRRVRNALKEKYPEYKQVLSTEEEGGNSDD